MNVQCVFPLFHLPLIFFKKKSLPFENLILIFHGIGACAFDIF